MACIICFHLHDPPMPGKNPWSSRKGRLVRLLVAPLAPKSRNSIQLRGTMSTWNPWTFWPIVALYWSENGCLSNALDKIDAGKNMPCPYNHENHTCSMHWSQAHTPCMHVYDNISSCHIICMLFFHQFHPDVSRVLIIMDHTTMVAARIA